MLFFLNVKTDNLSSQDIINVYIRKNTKNHVNKINQLKYNFGDLFQLFDSYFLQEVIPVKFKHLT